MTKLSARRDTGVAVVFERLLMVIAVSAACLAQPQNPAKQAKTDPVAYLNRALDEMQARALRRSNVDWPRIRAEALSRAKKAAVPADTYDAIRFALASLNDHHSALHLTPALENLEAQRNPHRAAPKAQTNQAPSSPYASRSVPEGRIEKLDGKLFALAIVPKCAPENARQFVDYESKLQRTIAELDRSKPTAWVVDLRGNGGNNLWPMLAGVGPLLGEGDHLGEFLTTHGNSIWKYRDGVATEIVNGSERPYPAVEGTPYKVAGTPTVAVLIDGGTAIAGEAIAIAFRGRPQTRFFGEYTAGLSTVSETVALPDGASMLLTIGIQADRAGKEYLDGLGPDEVIPGSDRILSDGQDEVLQGALWWLSHLP
jgi:carboxyl-terminal processing protease